jgi:hypothetical protein
MHHFLGDCIFISYVGELSEGRSIPTEDIQMTDALILIP